MTDTDWGDWPKPMEMPPGWLVPLPTHMTAAEMERLWPDINALACDPDDSLLDATLSGYCGA